MEPLIELWKVTGTCYSPPASWEYKRWKATRDAIHRTLEKIGKPAVALLIQMLREDEVEEGRPEWYDASDDDSYVNGDAEALIRCFAADALGNIGDTQAVEPLIELLGDEDVSFDVFMERYINEKDVHDAAKEALMKLGHEVE